MAKLVKTEWIIELMNEWMNAICFWKSKHDCCERKSCLSDIWCCFERIGCYVDPVN